MASDPTWPHLEKSVREYAEIIYGARFYSKLVHGRQIDAYSELSRREAIAIEVTEEKNINKIQDDVNKLIHVRNANAQTGILTRCVCVTSYKPTDAMRSVCDTIGIDIYQIDDFAVRFLPFEQYRSARLRLPFGSAVKPESGEKDDRSYVFVRFITNSSNASVNSLCADLLNGETVILTGEYGTGKSKALEKTFDLLADKAWAARLFPIAIDLRKCWGLRDRHEILHRHVADLNLSDDFDKFLRCYNAGRLILLLDGFDELGTQAWNDNPKALRQLRAEALAGVRDLIGQYRGPKVVAGRQHYFDNDDEMTAALGLGAANPKMLRTNEEFSYEEITEFLSETGFDFAVPEWLPRKPLTCELFARIYSDVSEKQEAADQLQFWDLYVDAVCAREAKTHPSFDVDSIRRILVAVAAAARTKPNLHGPLTMGEIQKAFESAIGSSPVEQASVLLQRLPGLGRVSADSDGRQFIDTYLLDGLNALNVLYILDRADVVATTMQWIAPLSDNSLFIAGRKIVALNLLGDAVSFCNRYAASKNRVLISDVVASLLIGQQGGMNFNSVQISEGHFSSLYFNQPVSGLFIEDSVIEKVVLSGVAIQGASIVNSMIELVEGISSKEGVPSWLKGNTVTAFSSVATVSRIKNAQLSSNHKVLVTILRKTFFQKGSARQEEALLRGLGQLVKPAVLGRIMNRLIAEGLLTREKGNSGDIYVPQRDKTQRAQAILSELNLSKDVLWDFAGAL